MPESDDIRLLKEYAESHSEPAFTALVERHVNLVYSAALRSVGNATAAEEITQAVFIILARKAKSFGGKTVLPGWLYQTARLTAANHLRGEIRRQNREQEAYMQSILNEPESEAWRQISPLLDDAMGRLGEKDRNAIVLRFFENKNLAEVGVALGASEDAAKMRVNRALEKLRKFFSKRGVALSGAIIAGAVSANSVQAAPVALAKTISAVAIAKGAAASASTLTLIKGTLKIMAWTKMKFACGVGAGLLLAGSVVTVAIADKNPKQPDPVALLKGVAVAREQIESGEMEFLDAHRDSRWHIQTNYILLKVAFDGEKLRFEQLAREYAYVPTDPEAIKRVEEKYYELHGDNDALVKLGLLTPQSAHYRTINDGNVIMEFDPRLDATIQNSNADIGTFLFDPRTFGLNGYMFHGDTVEGCLGLQNLKPVSLVGKEDVDGIPAWRVNVQVATNWPIEFWIDAAHPTHVIKMAEPARPGTVWSEYDPQNPDDPLPIEVNAEDHEGKTTNYVYETHVVRRNSRYNVPIQPKAFTLAGLDMPIGTPVVDVRIHRRIGYWNGKGFSENLPRNVPPRQENQGSALQNNPASLMSAKTDGGFVDEHKIVLRRTELIIGAIVLIFVVAAAARRFKLFSKRDA